MILLSFTPSEMPYLQVSSLLKTSSGKTIFNRLILNHRNEYAQFKQIRTKTIQVQGDRGEGKKAKLFITLERHPKFHENIKKFNEIREENERTAKKKEEETK